MGAKESLQQQLFTDLERYLARHSKALKLALDQAQCEQLVDYVTLLLKWNRAYNLTAIREPRQMLLKHVIDSLSVAPYLSGSRFIDVGTGAGLPGIPLALLKPDCHFVLLDSNGKKTRFMQHVKQQLDMDNIQIEHARVEQHSGRNYDGVLSRAFASINDMLTWCAPLKSATGCFYALKGQRPEAELAGVDAHYAVREIVLDIPELEGERHLIVIAGGNTH